LVNISVEGFAFRRKDSLKNYKDWLHSSNW